ncbi:hypothetical protein RhiirA4_489636, partial [Rhizophagus irregularis]
VSTFQSSVSKVPAFLVAHFEGFRLSGYSFQRFSPFWSPISKVPAFLVTSFEGSHLFGHPF